MKTKDLRPNPKNPRKMTLKAKESLKKSLQKYGDLSGFVYNTRSKTLISGHQKRSITPESKITIEHRYETPTAAFTTADGYVEIDGEKFKYREVYADPVWEAEAMIAANKHSGEWDQDLLKVLVADIPQIDLEVAGFSIPEIKAFEISIPEVKIPNPSLGGSEDDETDEQYVKNTPQTTEQIDTESQRLNANPFENVKEEESKMNIVDKRFIIIIDCTSAYHKAALKEKINTIVKEAGGKFF